MYHPKTPPPVPSEQQELLLWVRQELADLQRELAAATVVTLQTLHVAPTKLQSGMVVLADGTDWNPGAGAGVYCYYGGSWKKLG